MSHSPRARIVWALIAAATLAALAVAPGRARAESLTAGNEAYLSERFEDAVVEYERLVAAGVAHETLFYNLGNAYYRAGMLGPAIYNYERALRIDPGHEDAAYNLEVARAAVTAQIEDRLEDAEKAPFWVRVVTFFSIARLTIGLLVLNALLFGLLIALRFLATGFVRSALVVCTAFIGTGTMASGALLAGHVFYVQQVPVGVVLADEAQMYECADVGCADRGVVHAGLRLEVIERRPGWLRVRLANGHEAWLPREAVGAL